MLVGAEGLQKCTDVELNTRQHFDCGPRGYHHFLNTTRIHTYNENQKPETTFISHKVASQSHECRVCITRDTLGGRTGSTFCSRREVRR